MSHEVELKFRIPAVRVAAVRRAVATASATQLPLAARYFDTADQALARGRAALRLRREGAVWVQTLKAEGDGPLQRLEHEVPLPAADTAPVLDISRHAGTPAGAVLARLLAGAADATLVEQYATEVQRTLRVLRHEGALVELALDQGEIRAADGAGGLRRLPLLELEFELKRGRPQALLSLAQRWVQRFGLVLDVRSKSERGHLLARGRPHSPPAKARPLSLPARVSLGLGRAAMLANTLGQVLANASVLADPGSGPAEPEHLHQLRVGLRRLRTVLALLPPGDARWTAGQGEALTALFRASGPVRDDDALAEGLWPVLAAAGAPLLPGAPVQPAGPALAERLAAPETQALWLTLIGLGLPPAPPGTAAEPGPPPPASAPVEGEDAAPLVPALALPLQRLWRQIRRDARQFEALDDEARHRLRRRIKRLRYALELSATLWPARRLQRLRDRLVAAQAPLGEHCDLLLALARCRAQAELDGRAWFAVGWLSAHRDTLLPACAQALQRLARGRRVWPVA